MERLLKEIAREIVTKIAATALRWSSEMMRDQMPGRRDLVLKCREVENLLGEFAKGNFSDCAAPEQQNELAEYQKKFWRVNRYAVKAKKAIHLATEYIEDIEHTDIAGPTKRPSVSSAEMITSMLAIQDAQKSKAKFTLRQIEKVLG